ncbi:hypothetical protein GHK33_02465 [Sinorhizobium meliloti]|uniref:phage exclusion protein Lit family protein n=1 Tax=Rhizobium meliloti TaxID=382 RepID=UPI000FDAC0C2|nr:phage exclusion protein Lit family protein [Sinorhizobium meliloti]MQW61597.1 hypothetical protein [Sinorhizobium meliloti]RVP09568.1 hypothetical protein CN085_28350 [Sinorhizobium meliloti]
MTNTPTGETMVLHLLRGAVPERADELTKLWREHGHEIMVAPSAKGARMEATSKHIIFSPKTIDFFWLFGFSAWRAVELYSPALVLGVLTGDALDSVISRDEDFRHLEQEYKRRLGTAKSLLDVDDTTEIEWPADIPMPTEQRESLSSVEQMATFDLVAIAVAFAFLHEFKHVQVRAEEKKLKIKEEDRQPANEEEMACDTWAREYIMSKAGAYAKDHGHSYQQVAQKRAMAVALAAVIIHALTPQSEHWGSENYPSIGQRLATLIAGDNLPDDSPFWFLTGCLLIGLMRLDGRRLDYKEATFRNFVMKLLSEMQ